MSEPGEGELAILGSRHTRADLLKKGAIGGGAVLGAGALTGAFPRRAKADSTLDVEILNFALTLEYLESTFYTTGLQVFGRGDFQSLPGLRSFGGKIVSTIYDRFTEIRDHEQAHVAFLKGALGSAAVPSCQFDFGLGQGIEHFVSLAETFENVGVSAYDGALYLLSTPAYIKAGSTIATVEARHASYLNLISGADPFPSAFDMTRTAAEVCALTAPFITCCPQSVKELLATLGCNVSGLTVC